MSDVPRPRLSFLGGAGTVTGSRFLLDTGRARVLVDCGMFQGAKAIRSRNWDPFPEDPATIDAVVCTHAHLDHVGYLPALVRDGFAGPIHSTHRTAQLARIVLSDSARLQEEEAAWANKAGWSRHRPALPLYTVDDAETALGRFSPLPLDRAREVAPGVTVTLRAAGHILGSATVELGLADTGRRVLVTGDLGRPGHPLLRPPASRPDVDVVLVESTYGDRSHDGGDDGVELLADVVTETASRGGTVLIPAFAVDRTEVVLHALGRLVAEGRVPRLPIHADSPMALAVLDVYRAALVDGDDELRSGVSVADLTAAGELHEARSRDESKALAQLQYPSILLSASGMATGGRVLHHLSRLLPDPRNAVVFAGFQAAGTRGERLTSGADAIRIFGADVPVRARIAHAGSFSVHADGDEILDWLGRGAGTPDHVHVVHGEPRASARLAERIGDELGWHASVPDHLDVAPLG